MANLKVKVLASQVQESSCGANISYNGGQSFPAIYNIPLGTETGYMQVYVDAYNVPDKFIFKLDGVEIYNSGYRGDSWMQEELNKELTERGLPIENIVANSNSKSSFELLKSSTATQTLQVEVYAPLQGTAWEFFVGCPGKVYSQSVDIIETNRGTGVVNFNVKSSSASWSGKAKILVSLFGLKSADVYLNGVAGDEETTTFTVDGGILRDITVDSNGTPSTIYITNIIEDTTKPYELQRCIVSLELFNANGQGFIPPKIISVEKTNIKATNPLNPIMAVSANITDPKSTPGSSICSTGNEWTKNGLLTADTPSPGVKIYKTDGLTPAIPGNLADWDSSDLSHVKFNTYGIKWVRFSGYSNDIWEVDPSTGVIIGKSSIIC